MPYHPKRKTKIVCTLGPATAEPERIRALMQAGMNLVRINCSHGEPEDRLKLLGRVREAASDLGLFMPVMFDLQGPKIRIGKLEKKVPLVEGQKLVIAQGKGIGNADRVYTNYMHFTRDLRPGDKVAVDDGKLRFRVEKVDRDAAFCVSETSGVLEERKGINLPDTLLSAPALSEKDLADLETAVREGVDFVAISFVRKPEDVIQVREQAARFGSHHLRFIAKIERPEALDHLVPIITAADGVMVARGDLGVEIGSHRVPMIQKEIIARANHAEKFVITATQMLESMIKRPVPTRAEASDVANAILDGTDACMLSGETATGYYPVEAVKVMDRIALESESHNVYRYHAPSFPSGSIHKIPDGLSIAAFQTANLMNVHLLIAFTNSGNSALLLSKKHPDCLIVGATIHEHIARRIGAYWGVVPLLISKPASVEEMFHDVQQKILDLKLAHKGELAILTAGYPLWTSGSTNLLKVIEI